MSLQRRLEAAEQATSGAVPKDPNRTRGVGAPRFPDIVEFVSSSEYLGQVQLFPLQLLILKVIFLAEELLTGFDRRWLARWGEGFTLRQDGDQTRYEGERGTGPDVLERMRLCRQAGRPWMREVIAVLGRRSGKGYIGAICAAYILWRYICDGDPHAHSGVAKHTRLYVLVFAITAGQARSTQWQVISDFITNAPCFAPYIAESTASRLALYAHDQLVNGDAARKRPPTFEILPCGATEQAARGRAVIMAFFDEMAFMTAGGANRSAEQIYPAVMPALRTFGARAFIYQGSSPWQPGGQFFDNYEAALAVDAVTGQPAHPAMWTLQLPTWALAEDWELTVNGTFEMSPGGPMLRPSTGPLITQAELDEQRLLNPDSFDTEYGAQWATAHDAYLSPAAVHEIFTDTLSTQTAGSLGTTYIGYADPGLVDDHFAFVVAHLEHDDDARVPRVVFDVLEDWDPRHHPGDVINTEWAIDQLFGYLSRFRLASLTVDQFNGRAIIDGLRQRVRHAGLNWNPILEIRQTTRAENFQIAETFKRLTYADRIDAPICPLARDELLGLRDNGGKIEASPTGRINKDDLAIAMMNAVSIITEPFLDLIYELGALKPRVAFPVDLPVPAIPAQVNLKDLQNPYADQLGGLGRRRGRPWLYRPPYRPGRNRFGPY